MAGVDINKLRVPVGKTISGDTGEEKSVLAFLQKDISLFGNALNDKKKERFYSELKILFSAGVDIKSALELIEQEQTKEKEKELYKRIREMVVGGTSLSGAIKQTEKFSPYEYYTLQIGEETGHLTEVLNDLSTFFAGKITQRRQVTSALSYPVIVLAAAFGAIFFMLKYVVPMFADVFKRFNSELPSLTKFIINISSVFTNYTIIAFFVLSITGILLYAQRRKMWFRHYGSSLVLRIPVLNEMILKVYLERFCRSMNLLIASRTQLVNAIDLVIKMISFYPIATSLEVVKQDIIKGVPLHESLSKFKIYNKRMLSLIKVAEEVNQMEAIFGKLAQQYSDEIKHSTSLISNLIEPIMIIFLGLLVAVILIAMYLPLFRLGASIH